MPHCCCGALQAACTAKELKELVTMPTIAVHAQPSQLAVSEADQAEMKKVRLKRRIYELMCQVSYRCTCTYAGLQSMLAAYCQVLSLSASSLQPAMDLGCQPGFIQPTAAGD